MNAISVKNEVFSIVKTRWKAGLYACIFIAGCLGSNMSAIAQSHEATLYQIGAVPAEAIDSGLTIENSRVLQKGAQVGLYGWISPYFASSSAILTDAQRLEYGLPKPLLSYSEYLELIDLEAYEETQDPLLFTVMAFVLEILLAERVEIEDLNDVVKIYEKGIGLEKQALLILSGRLDPGICMRLHSVRQDPEVLRICPVPRADDEDYTRFLRALTGEDSDVGFRALSLLFESDRSAYADKLETHIVSRLSQSSEWSDRAEYYRALSQIRGEEAIQALTNGLLTDPVTDAREELLLAAQESGVCESEFVRALALVAEGGGKAHARVAPSSATEQWRQSLQSFLTWIAENTDCTSEARALAAEALSGLG